ncbi:hypothetical protein [Alkalicoccus daliensis]|uniref:Uncharacterized protein n=1 Tax=Alkalicoccus daliensis TaxID=745820 RepID=A0A1H0FUV8_9BACI|nr:hypothetical protein [Alkalicoccus daliensis]SDN98342.1 hypothetical protein SAMN04488053_10597 [Alkalicoccus daliensis]
MDLQEQFLINKSGSLTEGAAVILETSDNMIIDSLTWVVWGEGAEENIHLQFRISGEEYSVIRPRASNAFVSNTPSNISRYTAPQWEIMEYDTAQNKFAFHFSEAPCILPAGCFVGIDHLSPEGEEIFYSVRIRGRKP